MTGFEDLGSVFRDCSVLLWSFGTQHLQRVSQSLSDLRRWLDPTKPRLGSASQDTSACSSHRQKGLRSNFLACVRESACGNKPFCCSIHSEAWQDEGLQRNMYSNYSINLQNLQTILPRLFARQLILRGRCSPTPACSAMRCSNTVNV